MTDESKAESVAACTAFVGFAIVLLTMPQWVPMLVDLWRVCR